MILLLSIFLVAQTQFGHAQTVVQVLASTAVAFGVGPSGATFAPYIGSKGISGTDNGDWTKFPSFNFDLADFKSINFNGGDGDITQTVASVEVRLDAPDGTLIATVDLQIVGGWATSFYISNEANLNQAVTGTHDLYIVGKRTTFNPVAGDITKNVDNIGVGNYTYFEFSTNTIASTINIDADKLSVYPNPAVSQLKVDTKDLGMVRISLMNCNAQILKSLTNSDQLNTIDVSKLPTGMYLLKIESEKGSIVKKVIVNK